MDKLMKANLRMAKKMEKENLEMWMDQLMKDILRMAKKMDLENIAI